MVPLIVCSALLIGSAADAGGRPPTAEDREAYRAEAKKAGRDADAQVKLALWCEARGLSNERLKHLSLAVLADPTHATARGLLGLVADAGGWRKPEAVAARVRSDADLAAALTEYNAKRDKVANTADAQWKLGTWCDANGLKAEASAHFAAVIRLDPKRDAAWRKLGYKKVKNRWTTDEQSAAEKAEVEAWQKANKLWRPLLEKWKGQLGEKAHRDEAEAALSGVTDPRAVPAVLRVFGGSDQLRTAQLLGQIDASDASRALAMLSVFGKTDEVRNATSQTLRRRDPRDFAELLIELMRDPIKYEVRPVGGPGSPGVLFVEGESFNLRRNYIPPPVPAISMMPGDMIVPDQFGLPVIVRGGSLVMAQGSIMIEPGVSGVGDVDGRTLNDVSSFLAGRGISNGRAVAVQLAEFVNQGALMGQMNSMTPMDIQLYNDITLARAGILGSQLDPIRRFDVQIGIQEETRYFVGQMLLENKKAEFSSQRQMLDDKELIDRVNEGRRRLNGRIVNVLEAVADQKLGLERETWKRWYRGREGYAYTPPKKVKKPTVVDNVAPAYQPQPISPVVTTSGLHVIDYRRVSCFGAGTLVHAISGPCPIETIRVGDLVLSQDTKSGALSYQPVMVVHHNPPDQTLKIDLDGDPVVATPIHRFWLAGKGWAMARDLKVGDEVRAVGGSARVRNIEDDRTQPVFNLEVARGHNFFVGDRGALVHDNSLVQPTPEPFDAPTTTVPSAR